MSLLSDADREQIRERFEPLTRPVRLLFFTQTFGCETCADTRRILDELASTTPLVTVDEVNLVLEQDRAATYGVDRAPAIVPLGQGEDGTEWDAGIRFLGIPAGYEFMSLLEAIELVASRESGLTDESRAMLAAVTEPMRIQVFTTPT